VAAIRDTEPLGLDTLETKCPVPGDDSPHPPWVMAKLTAADVGLQLNLATGTTPGPAA
jgi:hypothetical protein